MVGELVANWAERMDVTRVGWRAEGWAGRMDVMRAGYMAEWLRAGLSKLLVICAGLRRWM